MASKLIVNEIEHTDGSGTAVTMAKATIADATLTSATITAGTIPAAGVTGTLGSGVIFPAGHILRTFYVESDAQGHSISNGTTIVWDELDLSIPASNTTDYLIITLSINGILTEDPGAYINMGFRYSDNNWVSHQAQLGTVEWYNRPAYSATGDVTVDSSTIVIRVNHPISDAYHIRPKLESVTNSVDINQSSMRSTMLAMEVKG